MASSPVDVRSMLARQMVERMAKQGGPQQGGTGPEAAGQQLSSQLAELKGADPQMMTKAVEQMRSMGIALYAKSAFQIPGAARHIAKANEALGAALKELQQAGATANTVSSPIVNNAGMSPVQNPGGGEPSGGEGMVA